jgi:hypothetical protein
MYLTVESNLDSRIYVGVTRTTCPKSRKNVSSPALVGGRLGMKGRSLVSREDTMTDWLQIIRAEYHEIPGLHLTKPQAQRCGISNQRCAIAPGRAGGRAILRCTPTGAYVKA